MTRDREISKFISLILRHKPETIGITPDEHGWANVDELIAGVSKTHPLDMTGLERIVAEDEKQRYSFTEGDVFEIVIPLKNEANESNRDANMKPIEANHEANGSEDAKINDMVLSKISENSHIIQGKLAEELTVSRSTIQRATEALKKQGLIDRIGGTRGYWRVNGK